METQYQVTFADTLTMYLQVYRRLLQKRFTLYAVCFGALALWLLYNWFSTHWVPYILLSLAAAVGAVWYLRIADNRAHKTYNQRLKHLDGQEPSITVCFGEDILVKDRDREVILSYDQVAHIYFEEQVVILAMRQKSVYFFPYYGIEGGTQEEFIQFLKDKCKLASLHY